MAYNSILGRWLQQDPSGYSDGANLYQSEFDAPCTFLDSYGLAGQLQGKYSLSLVIDQQWVTNSPRQTMATGKTDFGTAKEVTTYAVGRTHALRLSVGAIGIDVIGVPNNCKKWEMKHVDISLVVVVQLLHPRRPGPAGNHGWPAEGGWKKVAYHEYLHTLQAMAAAGAALDALDIRTDQNGSSPAQTPDATLISTGQAAMNGRISAQSQKVVDAANSSFRENIDADVDRGWRDWSNDLPASFSWPTASPTENTNGWPGKSGDES